MRPHLPLFVIATIAGIVACRSSRTEAHHNPQNVVPFGIVLNSVENGARIYCPIRLLPLSHPESQGHDFPNPPRWHTSEADALIVLGHRSGLGLAATVRRYPRPSTDDWPFTDFAPPEVESLELAPVVEVGCVCEVIPGLRAAAFKNRELICFLVDTRGWTLEERGMSRETTMGLDLNRAEFLDGIAQVARSAPENGVSVVVFTAK